MSINKFVFDMKTGKLIDVESYDQTIAVKAKQIRESYIDWTSVSQHHLCSVIICLACAALFTAVVSGIHDALTFVISFMIASAWVMVDSWMTSPNVSVKFKEILVPARFLDIENTVNIAASTKYNNGLIAWNPSEETVTIYTSHRFLDKLNMYQNCGGVVVAQAKTEEPFIIRSQEPLSPILVDKMKTAQAGFESRKDRMPFEVEDAALYFSWDYGKMTLDPKIVDWLKSIVYVFQAKP